MFGVWEVSLEGLRSFEVNKPTRNLSKMYTNQLKCIEDKLCFGGVGCVYRFKGLDRRGSWTWDGSIWTLVQNELLGNGMLE